jgi:hypothetical protein
MGHIVDDIMKDVKAISYYMYHNWHWKYIDVVGFLPLKKILQKYLEPQQEDKKIELLPDLNKDKNEAVFMMLWDKVNELVLAHNEHNGKDI